MRLTVGPLPPAVYWRRRAIVLGVLLAAVFLVVPRCGSGSSGADDNTSDDATGNAAGGLSPTPSSTLLTPFIEDPGSATPTASGETSAGSQPGECTDAEIAVTVSTEGGKTEYAVGAFVKIFLKIKNVSGRSCTRDVGGTQQELRIVQGAQKLWSSDDCLAAGAAKADVRTLQPGEQLDQFNVSWNGRASTNCQTKPLPTPGSYQLIGRVGAKWSEPITLTLQAGK